MRRSRNVRRMSKKVARRTKRMNTRRVKLKRTKRKNTRKNTRRRTPKKTLRRTNRRSNGRTKRRTNRRTNRRKIIGGEVSPQPKLIRIIKKRKIINAFGDEAKIVEAGKICLMLAKSDQIGQILILFMGGDGNYKLVLVNSTSITGIMRKTISAIEELISFPDTLLKQRTVDGEIKYKYEGSELQKMYEYLKGLDTEKYKGIGKIKIIQAEALKYIDNVFLKYPDGEHVFTKLSSDPTKDFEKIKEEIMLERQRLKMKNRKLANQKDERNIATEVVTADV